MLYEWRSPALKFLQFPITLGFPDVQRLTTQEFAAWSGQHQLQSPLVLDARSVEEYALSHIKSAQHIEPKNPDLSIVANTPRDTPIVVYCAVGYRSAKVSRQLQKAGFTNVFNLSGGIFQWVNEGKPVLHNEQQTELVHPYNVTWGRLLKPSHHAEIKE